MQGSSSGSEGLLRVGVAPTLREGGSAESEQREASGAPSLTDAGDGSEEVFVQAVVQHEARLLWRHQRVRGWQRVLLHGLFKGRERRDNRR